MATAKDRRLYARIDIGFDEHDKIYPLSDAAFRAIVEATLYARRQLTDGFLADRLAVKRWGKEVLDELSSNDPERPSLVRVEGGWNIHDFAEHQTTNADIDAKREHGKKGAAKRWAEGGHGSPMGGPMPNDGGTLAKTETETKTKTYTEEAKASSQTREVQIPSDWAPNASHIKRASESNVDVLDQAERFKLHAETHGRKAKNWNSAFTTWLMNSKPAPSKDSNAWMTRTEIPAWKRE